MSVSMASALDAWLTESYLNCWTPPPGMPEGDVYVAQIKVVFNADGSLSPLQEGFRMMHGLQCGFCTPGMIVRAQRLLKENPRPSEEEIRVGISGNICRCTGYQNIVKAIRYAADKINGVEFKEAAE